jgi:hypothetical protein
VSRREAIAIALWAAFCIAVTLVAVEVRFSPLIFAFYIPAQLLLGVVVPRWRAALAPLVLFWVLGVLAYLDACPCSESEADYFLLLWALLFALPGAAVVALGVAISGGSRPGQPAAP